MPIYEGMAQAESTCVPDSVPKWFTRPNTITHPGTNWIQCEVTTLIETNALPLGQIGTIEHDRSTNASCACI